MFQKALWLERINKVNMLYGYFGSSASIVCHINTI